MADLTRLARTEICLRLSLARCSMRLASPNQIALRASTRSWSIWTAPTTNLASFTLTGVASSASLVSLSVAAIVPTGQATPFSQLQFYEVTGAPAAGNLAPGNMLTLVGTAAGNTGSISETVVQRTITYSTAVSGIAAGTHSYVVVGVDASGHGIVTNVIQIVVT